MKTLCGCSAGERSERPRRFVRAHNSVFWCFLFYISDGYSLMPDCFKSRAADEVTARRRWQRRHWGAAAASGERRRSAQVLIARRADRAPSTARPRNHGKLGKPEESAPSERALKYAYYCTGSQKGIAAFGASSSRNCTRRGYCGRIRLITTLNPSINNYNCKTAIVYVFQLSRFRTNSNEYLWSSSQFAQTLFRLINQRKHQHAR